MGGSGHRSPLTSRDQVGNTTRGYVLYVTPANQWSVWTGTGVSGWHPLDGASATIGQWTHVAATFEQSSFNGTAYSGTLSLYIDGVLSSQRVASYAPNTNSNLHIGAGDDAGNSFFFNGAIDNVTIFDTALDSSDVATLQNETFSCFNNPPVVDAGPNRTVIVGDILDIDGTVTDDGFPGVPGTTTIQWTQISGPGISDIIAANAEDTGVIFYDTGTYVFELSATDGALTTTDQMIVEVIPIPEFNSVATWKMNEPTWTAAANQVIDSVGGFHGQAINGTNTFDSNPAIAGDPGTCRYTDVNGSNQRIAVPYNPALNPAGDFTVAMWARLDGGSGHRSPLTSRDQVGNTTRGYVVYVTPANQWSVWTGTGVSGWHPLDGASATIGQWTHVAATFEQSSFNGTAYSGTLSLYIDGVLSSQRVASYAPNTASNLHIGAGNDAGNSFFFNGAIDNVNIYDSALNNGDIFSLIAESDNCN